MSSRVPRVTQRNAVVTPSPPPPTLQKKSEIKVLQLVATDPVKLLSVSLRMYPWSMGKESKCHLHKAFLFCWCEKWELKKWAFLIILWGSGAMRSGKKDVSGVYLVKYKDKNQTNYTFCTGLWPLRMSSLHLTPLPSLHLAHENRSLVTISSWEKVKSTCLSLCSTLLLIPLNESKDRYQILWSNYASFIFCQTGLPA